VISEPLHSSDVTGMAGRPGTTADAGKYMAAPTCFEETIQAFEDADATMPPPPGAIVCVGSSTIGGWRPTIRDDLSPLTVIPRGFGGSNMNDVLYYAERVVITYHPRAILLYEGDNDIAIGVSPELFLETVRAFVRKVHACLPDTRIYILSIKPSPARMCFWSEMSRANEFLAEECAKDAQLCYVSIVEGMLRPDGTPREDIFVDDGVHMNAKGYAIWREVIRPVLLERELAFERQAK